MTTLKRQQGMATILLVLLIGLTLMIVTASVARSLVSNKESSVAAHGQTNAQLMGWAGVSAFRAHILKQGQLGLSNLEKLHNTSVTLRNDVNEKVVIAKNIQVIGCVDKNSTCTISADISANNIRSQAATTIHAVYELLIKDGQVTIAGEMPSVNFGGNTFLSGTTLSAEVPNTKAVLNVDGGNASIQAGFKTNNLSKLTINVKKDPRTGKGGDVYIDCSFTGCGNVEIDINAEGKVFIIHPGNFGNIRALESVKLQTGVTAKNIEALGEVHLALKSTAQNISTLGQVELSEGSSATNIKTNGDVRLYTNVTATSVQTIGNVSISIFSRVTGDVLSGKDVSISNSTVGGDVKAYESVDLSLFSKVNGSVYSKGIGQGTSLYNAAVQMSSSWVGGNISAYGDLSFPLLEGIDVDVQGNVNLKGKINSIFLSNPRILGKTTEKITGTIAGLDFVVPNALNEAAFRKDLSDLINGQLEFQTRVDVTEYKKDVNYIFTKVNGMARVYLNHLKNEKTKITYMYEDGKQYAVDQNKNKTLINNEGFYLGKYTRNTNHYVGAICLTVEKEQYMTNSALVRSGHKSGYCSSEIIGYLPRVSMDFVGFNGADLSIFGWPVDYDFTLLPDTFYIRSMKESSLENAAFAPGIFYFEGKLIISGDANINADSMSTAFTNSFLAEGSIDAIAFSPRIYSPYNVTRGGTPSIICSRNLNSVNNTEFSTAPPATQPQTISNKFLTPVNLCKDENTFSYKMNKVPDPSRPGSDMIDKIKIDGVQVKKLDLGLVALMSNRIVRIGACAQIYGDVLARSTVEGSAACGITKNPNAIVGSISSQGVEPFIEGIQQINTFGAGSKIVIPKQQYTNAQELGSTSVEQGLVINSGALKWAKYL